MEENEIQDLLRKKFGEKVYFQKFDNLEPNLIIYGVHLFGDDFMDFAGKVNINELLNN